MAAGPICFGGSFLLSLEEGVELRLLVTAGATCEDIDDVRFLSNRSTGKMGSAIATEALRRGHQVALVAGVAQALMPEGVMLTKVRSAREMLAACQEEFPSCQALVASAAVCDYRPVQRHKGKFKKTEEGLVLRLERNPDIAATLGQDKSPGQIIVGFALEATDIYESRSSAEGKLADKNQDMIVLNGPAAMGAEGSEVSFFVPEDGWSDPLEMSKTAVAVRILDFLELRLNTSS